MTSADAPPDVAPTHGIELRGAAKNYGGASGTTTALQATDLTIEPGQFVSVVGPSGCGKTTMLRLIAGLAQPSTGTIHMDGELVTRPRREVGIIFQRPVLLPWRRVTDNILLPVDVTGRGRRAAQQKVRDLLKLVHLSDFGHYYPGQLSGGMQQRVAICRALMLDPRVLLMDEPFAALDAMTREQMGVELLNIWGQVRATVVFVTHSIPEAVFLSDRVLVMSPRPGRVIADVRIDLPRPRTLDLLSSPELARLAGDVRGLVDYTAAAREPDMGRASL